MPILVRQRQPWTRKHDLPGDPLVPAAPRTAYPVSLEELIELGQTRRPGERLRATGSHWSLSDAAVSDHTFIETHDPQNRYPAMGRTLHDVVPSCLDRQFLDSLGDAGDVEFTLIHVEAGKRIHQLYAELDQEDDLSSTDTLAGYLYDTYGNSGYAGPWAFETLGGAGGQTVVGALTTGTHGGDFRLPPLADSVVALHLVADGGRHYWIESVGAPFVPSLTDDSKLRSLYDTPQYRGDGNESNFEIIRDNDVFDSVLVSAGRFGVIYSVVLRAVPQYILREDRRLWTWQEIKDRITYNSDLYKIWGSPNASRFLQIAVCLTPHANFTRNLVGVTKRWNVAWPPPGDPVGGRDERVGALIAEHDVQIGAPRFEFAGRSHAYRPDPTKPHTSQPPSMLERACTNAEFLRGLVEALIAEIEAWLEEQGLPEGSFGAVTLPGGQGLDDLLSEFAWMLEQLRSLLSNERPNTRLAESMDDIRRALLEPGPDERLNAVRLLAWQAIAYKLFTLLQENLTYDAISYAVMDIHDYLDRSCNVNVDSIEVFFDATDDRLVAFIDALLAFEQQQEFTGKAFLGYASLRFVGPSRALLAPSPFPMSCSIEIACLKDVVGSQELIDYAEKLARDPSFGAIIHWGQRCRVDRNDVERIFGDAPSDPRGKLHTWRAALSRLTDNGRLDGFSNEFTRRVGLEVVQPRIGSFAISGDTAQVGDTIVVNWDCRSNPPTTEIILEIERSPSDRTTLAQREHKGSHEFVATNPGTHVVTLRARHLQRWDLRLTSIVVS